MNPDPVANLAEIQSHPERFPVGSTLVLTWQPVEAASLAPVGSYAGTNGSLFDALIPCGDRVRKAHLYRFVGDRTNGPEDSFGRR
jgi:hypothetical protein